MAHGVCEGIWLTRILQELRIEVEGPIRLKCDNQAATSIVKNHVHHDKTKHVEVDRHFIREKIDDKTIDLCYTASQLQTADILIKALHRPAFENMCSKLEMDNIYCPA